MFYLGFFHGDLLIGLFSSEQAVISAGADYLKSYAIDCMLTSFLFCFIGYFNGCGETKFVMAQGIIGAFGVRVPVSWFMSRIVPVSLFRIGLATPCSSSVQILLSFIWLAYMKKREKRNNNYGSIGRTENSCDAGARRSRSRGAENQLQG
jgi:Na+-driven multidrug efflux pump